MQFHDDDAVPDMNKLGPKDITKAAKDVYKALKDEGLTAEFVAPRLWEDPRTIDGGYTSNDPEAREYAKERSRRAIDIAVALNTKLIVLWLAREGTYIREAKDPKVATHRLVEAIDDMLDYNRDIKIAIEPKPNEPMDQAYIPTTGHALALGYLTKDQGRVLDRYSFGTRGEFVGLDVKAMRGQKQDVAAKHLTNSRTIFLRLVELVHSLDQAKVDRLIADRDYEELDMLIVNHLMGR